MDLITRMEEIAKRKPARIVVCEGRDERCLRATADIMKEGLAHIILLGSPEEIKKKTSELQIDIGKAEIIDHVHAEVKGELIEKLVKVRAHKGMTKEKASELIEDVNYFACTYALCGYADGVAGSAICPTAELMRPALQLLRKESVVSEVLIARDVKNDGRILFTTDSSLNIKPTPEQLAQITLNAVDAVRSFEIEPRVAMLSFSTKGSGGDSPEVQVVRDALSKVKEERPNLIIDGEMQVDAAVNPKAAKSKCPDSILKGEANTLVLPNLEAANIFAHALMQFSDMDFLFTVLEGLVKSVGILGRSSPQEMVRNIIVSCAMQANTK